MINLGLIGKNISHSLSPAIYKELLPEHEIKYSLIDIDDVDSLPTLDDIFNRLKGLSITTPYKKNYLGVVKLDDISQKTGAINCIKKVGDLYYATNTDYFAVEDLLQKITDQNSISDVIVLGDGVMSQVAQLALEKTKLNYQVLSRKNTANLGQLDLSAVSLGKSFKLLVINSCSRAFSFNGKLPLDSIFWDFNYAFERHEYLKEKCCYLDGFEMLKIQAMYALKFWGIE